jgi:hypothetical protein
MSAMPSLARTAAFQDVRVPDATAMLRQAWPW